MKKVFSLFLILCLLLSGCAQTTSPVAQSASLPQTSSKNAAPEAENAASSAEKDIKANQSSAEKPVQIGTGTPESDFWIRFLDVGQADSALVMCGGNYLLIDGGNVADSNLIYSCLKAEGVETLDYIVCTHGHEDHVGGLSGALNACGVKTVLSSCEQYDTDAFRNFVKYVGRANAQIKIPEVGDEYELGGAAFTILSPSQRYENENNNSIVLRITYGGTSFLFMGDAEREAERDILDGGFALESDLIKIGHHGSETSTSYVFLREVMPDYAIISVGKNNSYGHPDEAVLSRLRDADVTVLRTDQSGDILIQSDGKKISVSPAKKTAAEPSRASAASAAKTSPAAETGGYIGNLKTKVVHLPSCGYLPNTENRIYFATLEAALAQGYKPCGHCRPGAGDPVQSNSAQFSSNSAASVDAVQSVFIGNKNTKKVHLPSCSYLPDEKNRVYFQTYRQAVEAGCSPCQKCRPDR